MRINRFDVCRMVMNVRPLLYKMTDRELVAWAHTIRDPLTVTDLEQELLKRFMQLTGITIKEAFSTEVPLTK